MTGKAKAMGTAMSADMAVAAVTAVAGTEGSASEEEEATSVVVRVEVMRLEVGVVVGKANGAGTVQVAMSEA